MELYFEGGVGVGHEEALRGGDGELGEPEEVVEGFGVGVEYGEGELTLLPHRAEAQLVGLGDGQLDWLFELEHFYNLSRIHLIYPIHPYHSFRGWGWGR